ncbi:MAG TPA: pitrilysin family protein [Thermoanaerobaculia bacterium]|jgi:predicted Zn-dependent peptidase|nr:pitrilysin family protein [Thermoanaerobaculia bacterium]
MSRSAASRSHLPRVVPLLLAVAAAAVVARSGAAVAQDLASMEARTTVHRLVTGWTFVIVERPTAPVFSFATVADVGSAQEVPGITGLAHMFEHMAFKGSQTIGTRDYAAEKPELDALEAAYQAYQTERLSPRPDARKLEALRSAFQAKQREAERFVARGDFDDLLSKEGGVGLNAFTAADRTVYFYSLPANKVELFAFAESERFFHPVLREFYEERDVVREERRMRIESSPVGRLVEQWITTAFQYHPYQQPGIGSPSDLESISITDARKFFDTYYGPGNLTTVIVGDVHAATLVPLLDKYFGRIPARPDPPPLRTVEPPQIAERTVVLRDPGQPLYIESYHKPAQTDADQPVYDAIDDVLSRGRTSRLYRSLVRDKKVAVEVGSFSGFPGPKYPNLWAIYAFPAVGVTDEQVQAAIRAEIERLQREDVSDEELARFQTHARAGLLRKLTSNDGLALELSEYQRLYGDWRELFRYLDRLQRVTKADIRRVAVATLQAPNRTVAMTVHQPSEGAQQP